MYKVIHGSALQYLGLLVPAGTTCQRLISQ